MAKTSSRPACNCNCNGSALGFGRAGTLHRPVNRALTADCILADPAFNMSDCRGGGLREDARWRFGVPPAGHANPASRKTSFSTRHARAEIAITHALP